jgi:hypothetical protein
VGPAGTGKTYLQRAVGLAAQAAGVPVLGLTVGQNAAYVLAAATREGGHPGIRTENIAMWLHAQHLPPKGTTTADWTFQPGQWVIVDEASQASSVDLARLTQLLDKVGGKLILVGDPAQVSAVGPGGLFRYLASLGNTTTLQEVRRFTDPWVGPASLRIRDGDTTVLAEYDRRGRITSGDRTDLVAGLLNGWAADILQGRTALMLVQTEAEAADLAAQARRILIRAGVVRPGPAVTLGNGTRAGVGDLVVTRRNNRRLTAGDAFVANRDQWKILTVSPGGDLHVENTTTNARLVLPARYVAEHVQLAYAATVDSAQGRTVDTARSLISEATSRARLYVMITRGRLLNHLSVITTDIPPEGHPPQHPNAGLGIVADILRADDTDRSATETQQTLWADVDSLRQWGPVYDDLTGRAKAHLYVAVIAGVCGQDVADRLADDPAMPALATRLEALAAAGYDPEAALTAVAGKRELHSAADVAAVLAWRIDQVFTNIQPDPQVATSPAQAASFTARMPSAGGDIGDALAKVAAIADGRVAGLADLAAQHRPVWAHALGPIPDDERGRQQWLGRTAVVAAYRDRYMVTGDHPIGPEPTTRDPAQWGAWQRAQIVLGVATLTGQLTAAPDTELRALIAAQRAADAGAPDYVGGKLRTAHLHLATAEQHVTDAQVQLAATQATAAQAARMVTARTPKWWQAGPLQTRAATQFADAEVAVLRADNRVGGLRDQLASAHARVAAARITVDRLEGQHQVWNTWYAQALPTRYAGLGAAAEVARRAAVTAGGVKDAVDAVRRATERFRAVDDTRPRPHHDPVPDHLTDTADAGHDRAADHIDLDVLDTDVDDLDFG